YIKLFKLMKLTFSSDGFYYAHCISVVHEYVGIHGCSETDGEDMHELDEEEMWHADFNQKRGVVTLPDFANPLEFPHFYETSVIEMTGCKSDVAFLTKIFKSPPPEMDAPHTSIYLKDDVELGVQNTLICHVTGFYPPSLSISWTTNNANVTEGKTFTAVPPKHGVSVIFYYYHYFSSNLLKSSFSCYNFHASSNFLCMYFPDVDVALPSVGPAVFCGVGLTLGLLGVAAGTFLLIKGNHFN
uniref:Ig-like domain-containing protein n=1 Tax=Sinocyclocheilus rhinocerous TaxID=307959 RepID=A0A673J5L7_9TELE